MKNMLRVLSGLVIVLVLLTTLSVFTASAQGPSGTTTPTPAQAPAAPGANTDNPGSAATLGSAVSTIPSNGATWYQFDYNTAGNTDPRPLVTIRLVNGVTNGLNFEVWSNERINSEWNNGNDVPVGRGSPEVIPGCTTTLPDGTTSRCTTNDLVWVGGFGADGTYYVRVVNNTGNAVAPQLIFSGDGLNLCSNGTASQNQTQANGQGYAIVECGAAVGTITPGAPSQAPAAAATTAPTETPAATATTAATESPTAAATSAATSAATTAATETPTAAATSGASSAATPAAAPTTSSGTPSASGAPSAVTGLAVAQNTTLGPILTDDKGRTVYAFVNDTSSASNCNGSCAQIWLPLAASASAPPTAGTGVNASMIGTINRSDGTTQLTYNGHPLYYYSKDTNPGDTNGQGFKGLWWTVKPDGTLNQMAGAAGTSAAPSGSATAPSSSGSYATPSASATP